MECVRWWLKPIRKLLEKTRQARYKKREPLFKRSQSSRTTTSQGSSKMAPALRSKTSGAKSPPPPPQGGAAAAPGVPRGGAGARSAALELFSNRLRSTALEPFAEGQDART